MRKIYFITLVVSLSLIFASCAATKTSTERIQAVSHKIQSKDFRVTATYANPFRMRSMYLTSEYDLRIKNDSAFAYLPYFGVAHTAPINSTDGGIKFAEPMTNYKLMPNKKLNGWDIRFTVKSKGNVYEVFMNIFNNGSAEFTINSQDKDMISFNGNVVLP